MDVQLSDSTFSPQDFEVVGGQLKVAIGESFTLYNLKLYNLNDLLTKINFSDRIAPGANATHVAVIRPLRFGYFNFTAAEVSYLPAEDAAEVSSLVKSI